jgi:Helix-turn-helix domain
MEVRKRPKPERRLLRTS